MVDSGLRYFTHHVDGAVYGAWYRVISSTQLEVIGVGILEPGEYAGFSPESSARSILENFLRRRRRLGAPVSSLSDLERPTTAREPQKQTGPTKPADRSRSRT